MGCHGVQADIHKLIDRAAPPYDGRRPVELAVPPIRRFLLEISEDGHVAA